MKTRNKVAMVLTAVGLSSYIISCSHGAPAQPVATATPIAKPVAAVTPKARPLVLVRKVASKKQPAPIIGDLTTEPPPYVGDDTHTTVCDSTTSLDQYFNNTDDSAPLPSGCFKREVGKVVVLRSAGFAANAPTAGGSYRYQHIYIRSMHGNWSGYAMNNYNMELSDAVISRVPATPVIESNVETPEPGPTLYAFPYNEGDQVRLTDTGATNICFTHDQDSYFLSARAGLTVRSVQRVNGNVFVSFTVDDADQVRHHDICEMAFNVADIVVANKPISELLEAYND